MPYTQKEKKLYKSLVKEYGKKKADQIYHAMLNSHKHDKIFGARSKKERMAHKKKRKRRR